jgi:type II secretory pathway component PulC
MKQSLWILTSGSLIIFLCAIFFVLYPGIKKPKTNYLKASYVKEVETRKLTPSEISDIYENDLFNTYIPKPSSIKPEKEDIAIPKIPELINPPRLTPAETVFLEPIPYTLVGTVVSPVDTESIAVVSDNRTKKEQSYFIGEEIEDSQILDINYKSITLIRTNGQKETLYLPGFDKILSRFNNAGDKFSQKIDDYSFIIDPQAFVNKIRTLGNLISDLNIITAYENGKSIGFKIGYILEDSIAFDIGLEKGDIILNINQLPLETLDQRLEAYNYIINLKNGSDLVINFMRDNQNLELKYTLNKINQDLKFDDNLKNFDPSDATNKMIRDDIERRYKFAPSIAEIKESEREAIIKQLNKKTS